MTNTQNTAVFTPIYSSTDQSIDLFAHLSYIFRYVDIEKNLHKDLSADYIQVA